MNWTDPLLLVFQDVLVAAEPACARLTVAKQRRAAQAGDSERVVLATHLDVSRLPQLQLQAERWEGCLSVGLWLCRQEQWEQLRAAVASSAALRSRATFHAVLGTGRYPNALRNAPLAPFAPWAAEAPLPAPWVLAVDVDGLPSCSEGRLAASLAAAVGGGGAVAGAGAVAAVAVKGCCPQSSWTCSLWQLPVLQLQPLGAQLQEELQLLLCCPPTSLCWRSTTLCSSSCLSTPGASMGPWQQALAGRRQC